ncbi:DNA cytosine methyltransferase [Chitinophaga oryzae]|uniref:Cytosine-specific methyltransferase n=1 Tax=Chitinophaga oryzae TaxID=2725414 RepID=A0AAE6ZQJ8_9BACT|nr:DNA cytosine methyltransferase [Chitinophaga oryzae]QJB35930.1 DNA cytosine methyltransferase [Chitinophaga oryzae]
MTSKYTYIDLFAGCGGLSLGLHNAGWKGLFAIEKSPDAFKTLKYNLIEKKQHFDWPSWLPMENLEIDNVLIKYRNELQSLKGKVDLVAGGPPCQGFSTAGLRKENDIRNQLIGSYLRFIELTLPKIIFFENVKGFTLEFKKNKAQMLRLAKSKGKAYSQYVLETLEGLGYDVDGQMVDFSKYGIPQKRKRFILVGVRKDLINDRGINASFFFKEISKNKRTFLENKKLPQNPKLIDAISDLLKKNGLVQTPDRDKKFFSGKYAVARSTYQKYLRNGVNTSFPDSHSFPNHRPDIEQKFKLFLKAPRGRNLNATVRETLNINKHIIIPLAARKAAPTITTLPDDYIHYKEPRILTVREYARIQSFPDWYHFLGKYTTGGLNRTKEVPRYTQIGNAIPPLFGEQVGIALNRMINA